MVGVSEVVDTAIEPFAKNRSVSMCERSFELREGASCEEEALLDPTQRRASKAGNVSSTR